MPAGSWRFAVLLLGVTGCADAVPGARPPAAASDSGIAAIGAGAQMRKLVSRRPANGPPDRSHDFCESVGGGPPLFGAWHLAGERQPQRDGDGDGESAHAARHKAPPAARRRRQRRAASPSGDNSSARPRDERHASLGRRSLSARTSPRKKPRQSGAASISSPQARSSARLGRRETGLNLRMPRVSPFLCRGGPTAMWSCALRLGPLAHLARRAQRPSIIRRTAC